MYHLFIGNVLSTFLSAMAAIAVGRLLGPEGYGLYAIALIVPSYMTAVLQLGMPQASTRYAAKYKSEGDEAKATSFVYSATVFQLALSLAAVALAFSISGQLASTLFKRPELASVVTIAVISVVGQTLYNTTNGGLQGLDRMDLSALLQTLQASVKLVATVSLLLAGLALMGAVVGYTISFLAGGLMGFLFLLCLHKHLLPSSSFSHVKEALHYSAPIYFVTLMSGFVGPYISTLLANTVPNAQLGGYGAAVSVSTLITLLIYPISSTLFPVFSSLSHEGIKLTEAYDTAVRYSALFIVPAAALFMALSTILISAVYGRAYVFAGDFLALLTVQYLLAGFGSIAQGSLLNGVGETRKSLVVGLTSYLTMLVVATISVGHLGVYGAILASIVGQAVSVGISWHYVTKVLGTNVRLSRLWRLYLSSALAAIAILPVTYIPLHPIPIAIIGALSFLAVLVPLLAWTGAVTKHDIRAIQDQLRSVRAVLYLFNLAARYYSFFERA
jgi:O-antigen/teichoic acid export membrane protein